jgi:hypothetical protein
MWLLQVEKGFIIEGLVHELELGNTECENSVDAGGGVE